MKIYIGQSESVITRLNAHHAEKDFWTTLIIFGSARENPFLNTAHIEYIESRLITLASEAKQCELDNDKTPALKQMSNADVAFAEDFLSNILQCLPILGVRLFEKPAEKIIDRKITLFHIDAKGVTATGYEAEGGFVICKGSQAVMNEVATPEKTKRDRAFLIAQDVLKEECGVYVFTQDYLLNSPTNAADFVLAASIKGLDCWKDGHGNSLKEIRKRESEATT